MYTNKHSFYILEDVPNTDEYIALVVIKSDPMYKGEITGFFTLTQTVGNLTMINGTVNGLVDGVHGFHVHSSGNISNSCTGIFY